MSAAVIDEQLEPGDRLRALCASVCLHDNAVLEAMLVEFVLAVALFITHQAFQTTRLQTVQSSHDRRRYLNL
jgi:hypothetical protein